MSTTQIFRIGVTTWNPFFTFLFRVNPFHFPPIPFHVFRLEGSNVCIAGWAIMFNILTGRQEIWQAYEW